jgi:hypothetical protein
MAGNSKSFRGGQKPLHASLMVDHYHVHTMAEIFTDYLMITDASERHKSISEGEPRSLRSAPKNVTLLYIGSLICHIIVSQLQHAEPDYKASRTRASSAPCTVIQAVAHASTAAKECAPTPRVSICKRTILLHVIVCRSLTYKHECVYVLQWPRQPAHRRQARALAAASVVAVCPRESISPYKNTPWTDVLALMQERFKWEPEPDLQLQVYPLENVSSGNGGGPNSEFEAACRNSDIFLAIDMQPEQRRFLESVKRGRWPAFFVLDSAPVRHL